MKKLWGVLLVLGLIGYSNEIFGQGVVLCEGEENRIVVRPMAEGRDDIRDAFREYTDYLSPTGNAIWLCFQDAEESDPFNSPLTLTNTSGRPVVISGLNIQAGEALGDRTLLRLSGTSPVTLINSSFQNCRNCLSFNGNAHRVEDVAVVCADGSSGAGIRLRGNNHFITGPGTNITQCGTGVQIGVQLTTETFLPGNNIQIFDSELHHNGTAIHVLRGRGNYFRGNSIYENDSGDGNFSGIEGILLGVEANGEVAVPTIPSENDRLLSYAQDIEALPIDDSIVPAILTVRDPYSEGDLEIYFTLRPQDSTTSFEQGKEFYALGTLLSSEVQSDGSYLLNYQIPMRSSLVNKDAVFLFHHGTLGTSIFSPSFKLNGPVGVLSAAELEAPGATGVQDQTNLGGHVGEPGGTNPGGSGTPDPNEDEKKEDKGSGMTLGPGAA